MYNLRIIFAGKKDALIATSKSIVAESQEVSELAKKLAHECSDVRIKTVCTKYIFMITRHILLLTLS